MVLKSSDSDYSTILPDRGSFLKGGGSTTPTQNKFIAGGGGGEREGGATLGAQTSHSGGGNGASNNPNVAHVEAAAARNKVLQGESVSDAILKEAFRIRFEGQNPV